MKKCEGDVKMDNEHIDGWNYNIPIGMVVAQMDMDMDQIINEINSLRARVKELERARETSETAFLAQVIFDVGLVLITVLILMLWR